MLTGFFSKLAEIYFILDNFLNFVIVRNNLMQEQRNSLKRQNFQKNKNLLYAI